MSEIMFVLFGAPIAIGAGIWGLGLWCADSCAPRVHAPIRAGFTGGEGPARSCLESGGEPIRGDLHWISRQL